MANLRGVKIGYGRLVTGGTLCQLRTADNQGGEIKTKQKKSSAVAIQRYSVLGQKDCQSQQVLRTFQEK